MADKKVGIEALLDGLTLTPEEKAVFESAYGKPENLVIAERRYLRRDEGTRLAQQAQQAEEDRKAALAEAEESKRVSDAHMQSLGEWEQGKQREFAVKEAALEAERLRFREQLLAGGIDPNSAEGIRLAADNARRADPPPTDSKEFDKKYLSIDMAKEIAGTALDLPFKMPLIMARHQELYGTSKADWNGFQEVARVNLLTKNIPVEQTAEQFFKFGERELALKAEADEARINTEVENRFNTRMSELKLPGNAQFVAPDPNDTLFSETFPEKTKRVDPNAPATADEMNHFLKVNEELANNGVRMEY